MADKNFIVKNGLEVGGQEVVSSSGVVTSAALGGQTLASTDSPTFDDLTLTGDLNLSGDLNITGDVNSLSVTDLDVTDQTITLGVGQVESASGGSGIVVDGSGASILWDETNDEWDFNKDINVAGAVIAEGAAFGTTSDAQTIVYVISSTTGESELRLGDTDTDAGSISYTNSNDRLTFRAAAANRMTLDSTGLGIGTDSPYKTLEVAGDIQLDATDANIWLKSGATGTNGFINWTFNTNDSIFNKVGIDYDTRATTGFHIDAGYPITIDASSSGGKGISFALSGTDKMFMDELGKFGIGTDNPAQKLHVSGGNVRIDTDANSTFTIADGGTDAITLLGGTGDELYIGANNAYRLRFKSDGNVVMDNGGSFGIGTDSPDRKLSIHEAVNTPAIEIVPITDDNNADTAVLRLWGTKFGTANRYSEIRNVTDGSTANNELAFNTNGSEAMRIDSSGNITLSGSLTMNGNIEGQNITQLRNHNSSMYVSPINTNTLNAGYNQTGDDADIWMNYRGYQDGTTYFRDFRIGDGKNNGLLFVDGSTGDFNFHYDTKFGKARLQTNNTVSGQNYLTSGECFPLALRARSTTATNTIAMTFGHESGDYSNFIGSQKTGSGNNAKSELVFGGRQVNGQSFTEWGRWHDDGNLAKPLTSGFQVSSTSSVVTTTATNSQGMLSDKFNKQADNGGHNIGSDYNTSTGIYTAPVDGRYLFGYNIRWETADFNMSSYIRTYISVNDNNDFESGHQINGSNEAFTAFMGMSGSAIVNLSAGDTVRIKGGLNGGTAYWYAGESNFYGMYLG